jgi:hypothetical protein
MQLAKLSQQMANSANFYSHLTANYIVLWMHHLGRYKGSYWGLVAFSPGHFGSGVGSYKPSYHLEDGEGPRARVNCHFLVKNQQFTLHQRPLLNLVELNLVEWIVLNLL